MPSRAGPLVAYATLRAGGAGRWSTIRPARSARRSAPALGRLAAGLAGRGPGRERLGPVVVLVRKPVVVRRRRGRGRSRGRCHRSDRRRGGLRLVVGLVAARRRRGGRRGQAALVAGRRPGRLSGRWVAPLWVGRPGG